MSKIVTYFSASGVTARKAAKLAADLGADLYEIAPAVKYTSDDLNYMNKNSRSSVEMNDRAFRPALAETDHDFSGYDEVYIGFPIWWYTAPTIINTFIETYDLTGKKITLFSTSGGSTIDKAVKELKAAYPNLDITN